MISPRARDTNTPRGTVRIHRAVRYEYTARGRYGTNTPRAAIFNPPRAVSAQAVGGSGGPSRPRAIRLHRARYEYTPRGTNTPRAGGTVRIHRARYDYTARGTTTPRAAIFNPPRAVSAQAVGGSGGPSRPP